MPSSSNRNRLIPRPAPSRHPAWRKTYLWLIALIGTIISIATLAAALAPSPGHHVQPAGGVLGAAGLLFSMWIGWYAHSIPLGGPVGDAKGRLKQRERARKIAATNPALAAELRIGRPDLPRTFDDGGLVDVNQVPASWLAALPGFDTQLADKIVSTRDEVGGFASAADLEVTLDLAPGRLTQGQDQLLFRPAR